MRSVVSVVADLCSLESSNESDAVLGATNNGEHGTTIGTGGFAAGINGDGGIPPAFNR